MSSGQIYESWKNPVDIEAKLAEKIASNATLKSVYMVSNVTETTVRELYILGRYTLTGSQALRQYIVAAWADKVVAGSRIGVHIHRVTRYVDMQW